MSRGVLFIIATLILAGSLFLPWHHTIEERWMAPAELRALDAGIGCWHYRMPPVVGYQTPGALIIVVPLVIILGAYGIFFLLRPNYYGYTARLVPAAVALFGTAAIFGLLFKLDIPGIGPEIVLIVTICAIPVSFVKKKEPQLTDSGYRPPAAGSA